MTRLDSYSADVVEAVSFACGNEEQLACVHLYDGLALASDTFRLDMRRVDTDACGVVNPLRPDTLHKLPKGWRNLGDRWAKSGFVGLNYQPIRPKDEGAEGNRLCVRCGHVESMRDFEQWVYCDHQVPLVDTGLYRELVANVDEPKDAIWHRGPGRLDPLRLTEDEHWHWLMPCWRPGAFR